MSDNRKLLAESFGEVVLNPVTNNYVLKVRLTYGGWSPALNSENKMTANQMRLMAEYLDELDATAAINRAIKIEGEL